MSSRHRLCIAVACILLHEPLHAAILKVGVGPGCSVGDLPSAVAMTNANGQDDEIHLSNTVEYRDVAVQKNDAQDLTIRGGYADCVAVSPTGLKTLLDGDVQAPVIEATDGRIVLENLLVVGASLRGEASSGAGVNIIGNAIRVELKNVRISGNAAHNGGGLAIIGDIRHTIQVRAENLALDGNIADANGGGLYAQYANGILSGLLAENNHAIHNGGGAWLGRDAVFHNRNGKLRSGFFKNRAENNGGGVAIEGGGMEMYQISPGLDPATFGGNVARVGGGVYLFNDTPFSASTFNASDINAIGNRASDEGGFAAVEIRTVDSDPVFGGIHVSASAPPVGGGSFANCSVALSCNVFRGNVAEDASGLRRPGALVSIRNHGKGAAGFARFWSASVLGNTGYNLVHNQSDLPTAWAQEIHLRDALVHGNAVEKNLVVAEGFASVVIEGSTATENEVPSALIAGTGRSHVRGSIFTDDTPLLETTGSLTSVSNLMVRNDQGLGGFPGVQQDDPRFVDPANGDFQLRADSPALDKEINSAWPALDRNRNPRSVDLPGVPDFNTPRDLGCFERQ